MCAIASIVKSLVYFFQQYQCYLCLCMLTAFSRTNDLHPPTVDNVLSASIIPPSLGWYLKTTLYPARNHGACLDARYADSVFGNKLPCHLVFFESQVTPGIEPLALELRIAALPSSSIRLCLLSCFRHCACFLLRWNCA